MLLLLLMMMMMQFIVSKFSINAVAPAERGKGADQLV